MSSADGSGAQREAPASGLGYAAKRPAPRRERAGPIPRIQRPRKRRSARCCRPESFFGAPKKRGASLPGWRKQENAHTIGEAHHRGAPEPHLTAPLLGCTGVLA